MTEILIACYDEYFAYVLWGADITNDTVANILTNDSTVIG